MKVKVGDMVMFVGEGRYAKWFFGHIAVVKSVFERSNALKPPSTRYHCRVEWLHPVNYHGKFATVSDFDAEKFEVLS